MLARQRIEAFIHALQHLKIMPAVLRCCSRAHFGLSASDIKAYVLNRHLKTLAGILFDLPAKQGLNPLVPLWQHVHQPDVWHLCWIKVKRTSEECADC